MVLVGITLALRWPDRWDPAAALADDGRSASVLYGADLLARGGLPTLESHETEPPGAAHLTWAIWQMGERAIAPLDRFAAFWAALGVVGVFLTGLMLFGFVSGFCAALLYTLTVIPLDRMTLDPSSWALPVIIFSVAFAVLSLRSGKRRWLFACGVVVAWALMLDRAALLLLPVYLLLFFVSRGVCGKDDDNWHPPKRRTIPFFLLGVILGLLPTAAFYASRGALMPFLEQTLFPPEAWPWLWDEGKWNDRLDRLDEGLTGFWEFIALPTLWAGLALVALPLRKRRAATPAGLALVLLAVAAGLVWIWGFRFPRTAYLLLMPPICWIAAHPDGPLLRPFSSASGQRVFSRVATVLVLVVVSLPGLYKQLESHDRVRSRRRSPSRAQREAAQVGKKLAVKLPENATIWVWGPDALSIYFHAHRPSAIRYYKSADLVTSHRPISWRKRRLDGFKKDRGPSEEIGNALARAKPPTIVLSRNASRRGFESLADLLKKHYLKARDVGGGRDFDVYKRRDFEWLKPNPAPKPPSKPKRSPPHKR